MQIRRTMKVTRQYFIQVLPNNGHTRQPGLLCSCGYKDDVSRITGSKTTCCKSPVVDYKMITTGLFYCFIHKSYFFPSLLVYTLQITSGGMVGFIRCMHLLSMEQFSQVYELPLCSLLVSCISPSDSAVRFICYMHSLEMEQFPRVYEPGIPINSVHC